MLFIIIVLPYYLLYGNLFDNFWNLEHTEFSKVSTFGKYRFFPPTPPLFFCYFWETFSFFQNIQAGGFSLSFIVFPYGTEHVWGDCMIINNYLWSYYAINWSAQIVHFSKVKYM